MLKNILLFKSNFKDKNIRVIEGVIGTAECADQNLMKTIMQ